MSKFTFTNKAGVSLAIAPFLALDTYNHIPDPKTISVTSLLKPIRMVILTKRNDELKKEIEFVDLAPSSMGSAYHARLEQAWQDRALLRGIFQAFGYSEEQLERTIVNPTAEQLQIKNVIPIYTERRFYKDVAGWKITGQADLILNHHLHDFKSSSVWGYIYDSNAEDYIAQGSMYRWLSDGLIRGDDLFIEYLFTDWSQQEARRKPDYPQTRVLQKMYKLWPLDKTEQYVREKLSQIDDLYDADQDHLPECTKEELWQTDTVYKYFKNPTAKRATRNCSSYAEAQEMVDAKGGIVKTVPGEVKRCTYCGVVDICHQAARLKDQGLLTP